MWHEELHHSVAKPRVGPSGHVTPDLRFFMYLWLFIFKSQRNRSVGTHDVVAREYGDYVYRDKLDKYMHKDFYNEIWECTQCMEGETVLDCRCVPNTLFNQVGEYIVGDLKNMDG